MGVLLLLVSLIAPSLAQNTYYSSPCPYQPPSPSAQCACDIQGTFSTDYVRFVSNTGNSKSLDNICHTYFPLPDDPCTLVGYDSHVYCDGSVDIFSYIVTCNSTNTAIFTSPSCSFVSTSIGSVDGSSINVRQVTGGDCSDIFYVVGVNSCPNGGSANDLPQIRQLLNNNGIGCTDMVLLPGRLPYQCVTQQSTTNTGSVANCPGPSCESNYDEFYDSLPPYNYCPPPTGCGCSN